MTNHDPSNEGHRDGCDECAAVWADLARISAEARALPRLTPSRDLWAGIEERIVRAPSTRRPPVVHRVWRRPAVRLAAAASLLIAATATVTWRLANPDGSAPQVSAGVASVGPSVEAGGDLEGAVPRNVALRESVPVSSYAKMDSEIALLEQLVDERRAQLDPRTVEVLERSLALIDQAIRESRVALQADPASAYVAGQLARSYQSKLHLLRDAAMLPSGN